MVEMKEDTNGIFNSMEIEALNSLNIYIVFKFRTVVDLLFVNYRQKINSYEKKKDRPKFHRSLVTLQDFLKKNVEKKKRLITINFKILGKWCQVLQMGRNHFG